MPHFDGARGAVTGDQGERSSFNRILFGFFSTLNWRARMRNAADNLGEVVFPRPLQFARFHRRLLRVRFPTLQRERE